MNFALELFLTSVVVIYSIVIVSELISLLQSYLAGKD